MFKFNRNGDERFATAGVFSVNHRDNINDDWYQIEEGDEIDYYTLDSVIQQYIESNNTGVLKLLFDIGVTPDSAYLYNDSKFKIISLLFSYGATCNLTESNFQTILKTSPMFCSLLTKKGYDCSKYDYLNK